jgi:hypothetical protein
LQSVAREQVRHLHRHHALPGPIAEVVELNGADSQDFNIVTLGGGLTIIQTPTTEYQRRQSASDYDENLSSSDYDQFGFVRIPGREEMAADGRHRNSSLSGIESNIRQAQSPGISEPEGESYGTTPNSSESSLFADMYTLDNVYGQGLSRYAVDSVDMTRLIGQYRLLSDRVRASLSSVVDQEREDDEHKAFALFEMRSRIMEKDIERGLERQGGTTAVDDIVTTAYFREAYRIRDAVLVSKAWRDGANPSDIAKSALLTQRDYRIYHVKRRRSRDFFRNRKGIVSSLYYWEPVHWMDDTQFMLYRCPALGPRHMRGFEMFTVGDCQSILLKLTNQRCLVSINLRSGQTSPILCKHHILNQTIFHLCHSNTGIATRAKCCN